MNKKKKGTACSMTAIWFIGSGKKGGGKRKIEEREEKKRKRKKKEKKGRKRKGKGGGVSENCLDKNKKSEKRQENLARIVG